MNEKTKKLVTMAMLAALAYLVMLVIKIPVVLFLKYEPKDIIITIGGFIYGPLAACIISLIVSFVEFLTVSGTGVLGLIMNVISTCTFACTAAFIYKKKHTMQGAVIGLIAGIVVMVPVMILWNYLITPIYMGYPREAVVELLLPAFLPFNLIKGGLNAGITFFLYKPVVTALRSANLIPIAEENTSKKQVKIGAALVSILLVASCTLCTLVLNGIL